MRLFYFLLRLTVSVAMVVLVLLPQAGVALLTGPSVGSTCCICVKDGVYVAEGAAFQSPDGFGAKCASESCQVEYSACTDQAVKDKINGLNTKIELLPLTPPDLQVDIPGFPKFSTELELDEQKTFYNIPWIAEYINAVYRWGVSIAAVLAVIMIIAGGLTWLTAGGNSKQVETAKTYIIGALTGLVLALGSYTILWLINPQLTLLKPLRIPYVQNVALEVGPRISSYLIDNNGKEVKK